MILFPFEKSLNLKIKICILAKKNITPGIDCSKFCSNLALNFNKSFNPPNQVYKLTLVYQC